MRIYTLGTNSIWTGGKRTKDGERKNEEFLIVISEMYEMIHNLEHGVSIS